MSARQMSLLERLGAEQAETRRRAVPEIADRPLTEAVDLLMRALGDEDWRVRKEAILAAVKMAAVESLIDRLIAASTEEENIGLRNAAVEALSSAGPRALTKVLTRVAAPSADDRRTALEIIGASHDERAVALLVPALDDPDANVRVCAAEWLGEYRNAAVVAGLCACLPRADRLLRLAALGSLDRIEAAIPWPLMAPLLNEPFVGSSLTRAMGRSGAVEAVPALLHLLATGETAACAALAQLHDTSDALAEAVETGLATSDEGLLTPIAASLNGDDPGTIMAATRCLLWCRRIETVEVIVTLARNGALYPLLLSELARSGPPVVQALKESLAGSEGHRLASVIGLLTRLMHDDDGRPMGPIFAGYLASAHPAVTTAAAGAVARFGDETIIPRLLDLIGLEDPRIRTMAGKALADLGHRFPDAVYRQIEGLEICGKKGVQLCRVLRVVGKSADAARVLAALGSGDPEIRKAAASTLAALLGESALEAIAGLLADPNLGVRLQAVEALAGIGPAAADTIVEAIQTAEGPVASALVRALGKSGHPDAEGILAHLCVGPSDVASAAVEAAKSLGVDLAVISDKVLRHADAEVVKQTLLSYADEIRTDDLLRLLNHPDWDVRLAAVQGCERHAEAQPLVDVLKKRHAAEENDLVRGAIATVLAVLEERRHR